MHFWSGSHKKVVLAVLAVLLIAGSAYGGYKIWMKPKKLVIMPQTKQPLSAPAKAAAEQNVKINELNQQTAKDIAAGNFTFNKDLSALQLDTLNILITSGTYKGVKAAIDKIPDNEPVNTVVQKYQLALRLFIKQNDQTNYTQYRNTYNAYLLKNKSDALAAKLYASFDTLYPIEAKDTTSQQSGEN